MGIKIRKSRFLVLMLISVILFSCETEIDVIADWKSVPVIYGLLDPGKDTQFVRVEKVFLGKKNAFLMAKITDSIYYKDVEISLENLSDPKKQKFFLYDTVMLKDKGTFANNTNILYTSKEKIIPENRYRLSIYIPEYDQYLTAEAEVFGHISFTNIFTSSQRKLSFSPNRIETLIWKSTPHAKIYDITIRFYYLEVNQRGDTIQMFADWKKGSRISDGVQGGEKMSLSITGEEFYRFVANKIKPDSTLIRIARKNCLDFMFSIGGEELHDYVQADKPSKSAVEKTSSYSNISEGLGIFSCRFDTGLFDKDISPKSIDSLAHGIFTHKLSFVDYNNLYYR